VRRRWCAGRSLAAATLVVIAAPNSASAQSCLGDVPHLDFPADGTSTLSELGLQCAARLNEVDAQTAGLHRILRLPVELAEDVVESDADRYIVGLDLRIQFEDSQPVSSLVLSASLGGLTFLQAEVEVAEGIARVDTLDRVQGEQSWTAPTSGAIAVSMENFLRSASETTTSSSLVVKAEILTGDEPTVDVLPTSSVRVAQSPIDPVALDTTLTPEVVREGADVIVRLPYRVTVSEDRVADVELSIGSTAPGIEVAPPRVQLQDVRGEAEGSFELKVPAAVETFDIELIAATEFNSPVLAYRIDATDTHEPTRWSEALALLGATAMISVPVSWFILRQRQRSTRRHTATATRDT